MKTPITNLYVVTLLVKRGRLDKFTPQRRYIALAMNEEDAFEQTLQEMNYKRDELIAYKVEKQDGNVYSLLSTGLTKDQLAYTLSMDEWTRLDQTVAS